MEEYRIPVIWQMWGIITIKAKTLKEAIKKAEKDPNPLPFGHYIDDSWEVDKEGVKLHNKTKA